MNADLKTELESRGSLASVSLRPRSRVSIFASSKDVLGTMVSSYFPRLPHDLSYCMFLGAFDASVAKCDGVHSGQVLVDRAGGENAVHSCAASSDEASEIVS